MLLGAVACASPAVKQARSADWSALRSSLKNSELSAGQVRRVATAVLRSEVEGARDLPDRGFIPSLRACSGSLDRALTKRMKRHDGTGAEAAMLLVETGRFAGNADRHADDPDGAWRALSARANLLDQKARRAHFVDPDQRVRRAAIEAAAEARDADDVHALLEVARLDPVPLLRSRAFYVLGQIAGREVLQELKDRYENADETQRLALIEAYGSGLYLEGGREQLMRIQAREQGLTRVSAASRLARDSEPEEQSPAVSTLVRTIEAGSDDERRLALRTVPLHHGLATEALLEATEDENQEVALIAWARLLSHDATRTRAEAQLLRWAKDDNALSHQALAALSAAGDELGAETVQQTKERLEEMLRHPDPTTRIVSGRSLVRLGKLRAAAQLLADDEAEVRRRIACEIAGRPALPREL